VSFTPRRSHAGSEGRARRAVSPAQLEEFHRALFLPLVRRAAWRHGLSKEDARDVVQEAFLLAIVKMDPGGNPQGWLAKVVDHLSVNLRRKDIRHAALSAHWGPSSSGVAMSEDEDLGDL
jgi:DNA-directed RNA polymerase specialized sigma24 family protein